MVSNEEFIGQASLVMHAVESPTCISNQTPKQPACAASDPPGRSLFWMPVDLLLLQRQRLQRRIHAACLHNALLPAERDAGAWQCSQG